MDSKKQKALDEHRPGARSLVSISIDSVLDHATDEEISSLQLTHCLREMVVKSRKRQRHMEEKFDRAVDRIPPVDLRDQLQSKEMFNGSLEDATPGERQYCDPDFLCGRWDLFFSTEPDVAMYLDDEIWKWIDKLANISYPRWSKEKNKLVPDKGPNSSKTTDDLMVMSIDLFLYRAQIAFRETREVRHYTVKSDLGVIVEKHGNAVIVVPNQEFDLTIHYGTDSQLNDTMDMLNYILGPLVMEEYENHPNVTGQLTWSPHCALGADSLLRRSRSAYMKAQIAEKSRIIAKYRSKSWKS